MNSQKFFKRIFPEISAEEFLEKSLRELKKICKINPTDAPKYLNLGKILVRVSEKKVFERFLDEGLVRTFEGVI